MIGMDIDVCGVKPVGSVYFSLEREREKIGVEEDVPRKGCFKELTRRAGEEGKK